MPKIELGEDFYYDDLHGVPEEKEGARKAAEILLAQHPHGEILDLPGIQEYRKGVPHYAGTPITDAFLPRFRVLWEINPSCI